MSGHEVTIEQANRIIGGYWVSDRDRRLEYATTYWGARLLARRFARQAERAKRFPLTYTVEPGAWWRENGALVIWLAGCGAALLLSLWMAVTA